MSHNTIPSAQPPARRNQLDVLEDIAGGIDELVLAGGGGAGGPDKELITLSYSANKAFTGASQGDLITGTQVVDLSGASPVVGVTVWQNQTTRLALASAPLAADIDLAGGGGGATNAQLVAALATQTTAVIAGPNVTVGNIANGVADAGNPVKVGGVYATVAPTIANNQRGDLQLGSNGQLMTTLQPYTAATLLDGYSNGSVNAYLSRNASGFLFAQAGMMFNGTTWDRVRGSVNGAWVQGNVASGTADAGNPVKVGGVCLTGTPTYANAQRADLRISTTGALVTTILPFTVNLGDAIPANNVRGIVDQGSGYLVQPMAMTLFNGTTYDRVRGDTTGMAVNVLKAPLISRQIVVTAASAGISITAGTKRLRLKARGADMRYALGSSAPTATNVGTTGGNATSHFIEAGEALDIDCTGMTFMAAIADVDSVSQTGKLEVTELS